jgi:acetamidase/formamidase
MAYHHLNGHDRNNLILKWSGRNKAAIEISSGDTITFDIPDSSTDQIKPGSTVVKVSTDEGSLIDAPVGPVLIKDARKGDTLCVEILDIECGNWGWSMISKDFGLLRDMISETQMFFWSIEGGLARPLNGEFLEGISLRTQPFLGVIGVAPSGDKEYDLIPPQYFGGNMDNRRVCRGSKVYFPVNVDGALFAVSDPHALQGDGEVGGTAIEMPAKVKIRFTVEKRNAEFKAPVVISRESREEVTSFSTSGISEDLYQASRSAVMQMIDIIHSAGTVSKQEAYLLCSLVGSLHISEIVDMPHVNVCFSIDTAILRKFGVNI